MIHNLLKRLCLAVALFAMAYGVLQLESVQKGVIKAVIKLCSPYKVTAIQFKKIGKFPFEVNLLELKLSDQTHEIASFKNVAWKIASFAFNDISLSVEEVVITPTNQPVDFAKFSPGGIAGALHNFTTYLQWFTSINVTQVNLGRQILGLKLKRVNQISVVTLCQNKQDLVLTLTPRNDHAQLQIEGLWFNHSINLNAQIFETAIDFAAKGKISDLAFPDLVKILSEEVTITGRLVKDLDWQLKPLKIVTGHGHTLEGACLITDHDYLKLQAKLQADAANTANFDVAICLNPFEINGSVEIAVEALQKFWPCAQGALKLKASLTKVQSFEKGCIQLQVQGLVQGTDFYLPIKVDVDLDNGEGQGKFNIGNFELGKGHYLNHPFEAVIDFKSTATAIQIEALKLQLQDLQLALLKPTTYYWHDGLAHAQLQFCGGTIEVDHLKLADFASFFVSPLVSPLAASSGTINLHNIQLGRLRMLFGQEGLTGLLNGQLQKLPQMPLTLKLQLTQGVWQKSQNHQEAKHQDRQVDKILNNLSAYLDGNFDNAIAKWKLDIKDQDKINLVSTGHADLANSTVDTQLKGLVRLGLLTDWLGTGDRIFGDITLNLHGKGPMDSPVLEGFVDLDHGLYEHNEVGTFYQNITIRTHAQGRRLVITRFDAQDVTNNHDPAYGQLRGEGWVDFSNILAPVFHVPMHLEHLRISQNDGFISDASGTLLIAGIGTGVGCKGEVTLEKAEYFIAENSEKMIPRIIDQKISHKNLQPQNTGTAFPLDILVHVPTGAFKVTGTGADSSWKGDIYVKKSIVNPFLVGSVELHEGTLDILGKVLKITHGMVTFVDDDRNNPRLDIKAVKDLGDGVIVAIEIKGTGSHTMIDFTSTPSMAKEEVLALLLFGKKLGEVSVLQSIQLAELTKSNHASSKAGFFEKMRTSLGFDQFEFKTTTRGGAADNDGDATPAERAAGKTTQAVRIGKEFGKVQVGIEQGAGSETSKVVVSTPLGPNGWVLQGDVGGGVGGGQNSGAGVSWIKRY